MNKRRLNELKMILKEAISVINEVSEEELQSAGLAPKDNRDAGFQKDDYGSFDKDTILAKLKDLYTALESSDPDVSQICAILNSPELATGFGLATLANGDASTDSISAEDGTFVIGQGKPTQSQIFLKKSAAYPLSDWGSAQQQFDNTVKDNPYLKINYTVAGGSNFILDGHHRWSGAFCFGDPNSCEIKGINFVMKEGSALNRVLSNLQIAIKIMIEPGQQLPSATGGDGGGMDVFSMDLQPLVDGMMGFVGQPGTALDKKAPSGIVLGKDWFDGAKSHAGFKSWCEAGLSEFRSDLNIPEETTFDDLLQEILSEDGSEDAGTLKSKKLRQLVIRKVCAGYKKLPQPDENTPERKDMPQLGGTDGTPVPGKEAGVAKTLKGGQANIERSFDYPVTEGSIDLRRWNKLAGLLKD